MSTEATLTIPVPGSAMWAVTLTAGESRMPWGGVDASQQRSAQPLGEILQGHLIYFSYNFSLIIGKGWKSKNVYIFRAYTSSKLENFVPTLHKILVIMWGRDKNFQMLVLFDREIVRTKNMRDIFAFPPFTVTQL